MPCTNSAAEISFPMKTFILARELELARNEVQFIFILKILFIFRGEGREKEEEKYQCVVASCAPPTGDLVHNPGTCSDWELNWRPFGSQAGTQSTEPCQPGRSCFF